MPVINFKQSAPKIGNGLFLAPDAWIIGDVEIGSNVSIFFGAVLRGDIEKIVVGDNSNIQEHSVLHTSHGKKCIVGKNVTVGHRACLHSCEIADSCIIGMGATILDGAYIGKNCLVGANSLISMNTIVPEGSLVYGAPAKAVRPLSPQELDWLQASAQHYTEKGLEYRTYFAQSAQALKA